MDDFPDLPDTFSLPFVERGHHILGFAPANVKYRYAWILLPLGRFAKNNIFYGYKKGVILKL
jgi:hypothetical protein